MLSFGPDFRNQKLHLRATGAKPTNVKKTKQLLSFFSEENGLAASRVPGGRARYVELRQGSWWEIKTWPGHGKPKRRHGFQGSALHKSCHVDFPVLNS